MVTSNTNSPDNICDVVDQRTMELMAEFEQHYHDAIEIEPTAEGRREHVFHAWTFQKLAGIQIAIEEISHKFNVHIGYTE